MRELVLGPRPEMWREPAKKILVMRSSYRDANSHQPVAFTLGFGSIQAISSPPKNSDMIFPLTSGLCDLCHKLDNRNRNAVVKFHQGNQSNLRHTPSSGFFALLVSKAGQ